MNDQRHRHSSRLRQRWRVLPFTLIGLLGSAPLACSDQVGSEAEDEYVWAHLGLSCSPGDPAVPLPGPLRDALPPLGPVRTMDDIMAEATPRVPGGWGGSFFAQGDAALGIMTLWLVDPTRLEAAVDTLRTLNLIPPSATQFRALKGRWTFLQLYEWYRYLNTRGFPPGWTFSDIQEVRNRLEYGAYPAEKRETMLQHFAEAGIPCWLAAVKVEPPSLPDAR